MAKSASLNPADFQSGGAVQDGRYTIKDAQAVEFDYGGHAAAVPAVAIVYMSSDGATVEQNYSAGKLDNLIPSEDGSEFVHPGGEDAKIGKSSNFGAFVAAMVAAGFPPGKLGSKVTCFIGADVDIENKAQPKRPGLKDSVEGKTIPLPVKYHGQVTIGGKAAPKATAAPAASNGSLDEAATKRILAALGGAPDGTLGRVKLATTVWLVAQKEKDPAALQYKKLAGDANWLNEHAAELWLVDGDNVTAIPQ